MPSTPSLDENLQWLIGTGYVQEFAESIVDYAAKKLADNYQLRIVSVSEKRETVVYLEKRENVSTQS